MNKKEWFKQTIGYKNILRLKKMEACTKDIRSRLLRTHGKINFNEKLVVSIHTLSEKGMHVFFGYYDIAQLNEDGTRALIHIVPKNADPVKDIVVLAWVDLSDFSIHKFAESRAWSWQQGARLRWHPTNPNQVIYNDVEGKDYVAKVYDILRNKEVKTISVPLYDINSTGTVGLSLNFTRLQRLRPGYGYSVFEDETVGCEAPRPDGIYQWSAETNQVKQIINLQQLAKNTRTDGRAEHYINHISISPTGDKFLFFHLWSYGEGRKWGMKLYVANIDGSNLQCVDETETVSHYCWLNDTSILTTVLSSDRVPHAQYILYDLCKCEKKILPSKHLHRDGHPTIIRDGTAFLSDTYPQSNCMQYVFEMDFLSDHYQNLLEVYSNPYLLEEKRCDLHPRVDEKNKIITVDSTYNGVRSVLFLKMK